MNYDQDIQQNPCTPYTLRHAWAAFKQGDPVDSLYAARTLVQACEERLRAIEAQCQSNP